MPPPNNRLALPARNAMLDPNALGQTVPAPYIPGTTPTPASRFVPGRELENLSIGMGRGITGQLEGTKQMLTDPVGTVRSILEVARQIGADPMAVLRMLQSARQQAMSGALGAGEMIGGMLPITPKRGASIKQDIFIGEKAATWDVRAAQNAELLEKAGVSPQVIWERWGVWRGPDGKWRQEISDEKMGFKKPFESREIGKETNYEPLPSEQIENLLAHQSLMDAYPQLKNTQMALRKQPDWIPDSAQGGTIRSNLWSTSPSFTIDVRSKSELEALGSAIHELQHGVQGIEKFEPGASPENFYAMAKQQLKSDSFFQALPEKEKLNAISEAAFNLYRRTMGEAEARATESRRLMTPEQRRKILPSESYDIDFSQLIRRK